MEKYNKKLGAIGETIAVNFLKKNGFNVIEKNFSCKWGEIDIIAEKNNRLHFIEVKTRSNLNYGRPEEAVTHHKYLRAKRAVLVYLRTNNIKKIFQIDVLAILYDYHKNTAQIRFFPNVYR
jgi:putative endonuclease